MPSGIGKEINTLVFDLGEVIVDLNIRAVIDGFSNKSRMSSKYIEYLITSHVALYEYETGRINTDEFIDQINEALGANIPLYEFKTIWNSMLREIPVGKLQLLKKASSRYQTLILSNTNEMHEQAFDQMVSTKAPGQIMSDFVNHAYYSHKIGHRKPNQDIYEYIIDANCLNPQQTLFFDDKKENIEGAQRLGIQGVLITQSKNLYTYFEEV